MRSKIHPRPVPLRPSHPPPSPQSGLVGAGRFELPTPCSRSKCATRLRYAPPSHAQVGEVGQTPPKKRMIGPERSNLRLHGRRPPSPKLCATLQPTRNRFRQSKSTSVLGSGLDFSYARLNVCNGPQADIVAPLGADGSDLEAFGIPAGLRWTCFVLLKLFPVRLADKSAALRAAGESDTISHAILPTGPTPHYHMLGRCQPLRSYPCRALRSALIAQC